ncbi:hypothetical protein [Streptomyces luteogriseus]
MNKNEMETVDIRDLADEELDDVVGGGGGETALRPFNKTPV